MKRVSDEELERLARAERQAWARLLEVAETSKPQYADARIAVEEHRDASDAYRKATKPEAMLEFLSTTRADLARLSAELEGARKVVEAAKAYKQADDAITCHLRSQGTKKWGDLHTALNDAGCKLFAALTDTVEEAT